MKIDLVEVLGLFASVVVFISVSFSSTTVKRNILMRIINTIGSAIFIAYGCIIGSLSTAILNGGMIILNLYHVVRMLYNNRK